MNGFSILEVLIALSLLMGSIFIFLKISSAQILLLHEQTTQLHQLLTSPDD